jgi:hypothetical protein
MIACLLGLAFVLGMHRPQPLYFAGYGGKNQYLQEGKNSSARATARD